MAKDKIREQIRLYKKKYETNKLLRGLLFTILILGSGLLVITWMEDYFWFGKTMRLSLLILFCLVSICTLVLYVVKPLIYLLEIRNDISDEQAATAIGKHFPEISDKLLNYIQLKRLEVPEQSLLAASLQQKLEKLRVYDFKTAIDFKVNLKYTYYVLGLIVVIICVAFVNPDVFTKSPARIVQFEKEFERPTPFQISMLSPTVAFRNDPYRLDVVASGDQLPQEMYIKEGEQKIRMTTKNGHFYYNLPSLSSSREFNLETAGYYLSPYTIKVVDRPEIDKMTLELDYPAHTSIPDETIEDNGSVVVPEGTVLNWKMGTKHTSELLYLKQTDSTAVKGLDGTFSWLDTARQSYNYSIKITNQHGSNSTPIAYSITTIKDEMPEIKAEFIIDSLGFKNIYITGSINDDYGFRALSLVYKTGSKEWKSLRIPIKYDRTHQQFIFQWDLTSLQLVPGTSLSAFVRVTDNDAVNNYKSASSQTYQIMVPDDNAIEELIESRTKQSKDEIDKSISKAKDLNEKITDLEDRLRNKKSTNWQDKKLLEDILNDRKELEKQLKQLQADHEALNKSKEQFQQENEKLKEKSKQLQKLMDEVLDEETKKLYDELQKLLQEENKSNEIKDKLSQLKNKEVNLEKELERALELFKRLQVETKLDKAANDLKELADKQQKLADEADSKEKSEATQKNLKEKQSQIKQEFDKIKQEFKDVQEINEKLGSPMPIEDMKQEEQSIDQQMQDIDQSLEQEKNKNSSQQMKGNSQKMQRMSQKMQQMMASMEMTMLQENIDQLRDILDNLIKLSFEQELLIEGIQSVNQLDPRYIELSQQQLQLAANSEVIEDSLLSLASRVPQISSFVTREVSEINANIDRAMHELRERNKGKVTSHQQFTMTSMNNLALLLGDVLKNMEMSMAEAMGNPQPGGESSQSLPSLSEMQQQLSEQIQQLKQSGKSGRELSEELARMAAEQAEIKRQMEEMSKNLDGQQPGDKDGENGAGGAGTQLKEAIQKMEENEVDLVNKQLTQKLINRQQEILTRMLEAEQSMRKQQESPERKGETASDVAGDIPPAVEEYLKAKQKEIELLKTIPLDLNPFYKQEVNEYFKRLSESK